jgi:2-iminobutanoate/2-iminopropanoate deaminase
MHPIHPAGGPSPSGAYVSGIRSGGLVFVSGQGPFDPVNGELIGADVAEQVRATLANVERVLVVGGATLSDVVRVDAYLSDLANFDAYDAAFREAFDGHLPTRTTVQAGLDGILVEINAIAVAGDSDA